MAEENSTTTWSTGAGVVDSVAGFVDSLTSESEGEGPDVIDVALGGAGMVVDLVGTMANPLGVPSMKEQLFDSGSEQRRLALLGRLSVRGGRR